MCQALGALLTPSQAPKVGDRDKEQTAKGEGAQLARPVSARAGRSAGSAPKFTKYWKTEAGATHDTGRRVLDKYKKTPLL